MKKNCTPANTGQFFDNESMPREQSEQGIVIFTPHQEQLINELLAYMHNADARRVAIINNRISYLKTLAASIALFPSLLEQHDLPGGLRTPRMLINSLIENHDSGDITLQLPSKANLGKSFLIAKMHMFSSLSKQSVRIKAPDKLSESLRTEAIAMIFSLLAEDVYLNLIADKKQPKKFRRQWAYSLLMLWQYRTDDRIEVVGPILRSVWSARCQLAPTFGTMMGTSELLLISMHMDGQWLQFIKQKLGDENISQAMEEFLFGISYEQICKLRSILRTKGITAIGRNEASKFIGEDIKTDANLDYHDFYSLYTVRRDDARARTRMKLPGPHKTLEDYFMQFITEQKQ